MKTFDYICHNHEPFHVFEVWQWKAEDPCPANPPNCDLCGTKAMWYPTAGWKLNEEWGVGKYVKGYGWFDNKERFDKHLAATGRLYYESGMERDAERTRQYEEEKLEKKMAESVGQIVQERVTI